jgi:nucleoside-diphosphate kinase
MADTVEARKSPLLLEGAKTIAGEKGTVSERSFVMIKPDGVSRQLVGKVCPNP